MDPGTGFVTRAKRASSRPLSPTAHAVWLVRVLAGIPVTRAGARRPRLVVGLPGAGLEAASAGSEAESRGIVPPDTTPAQTDRFFHDRDHDPTAY